MKTVDNINFTAPAGYAKALEDMGHKASQNRSKHIVSLIAPAVEAHIASEKPKRKKKPVSK